MCATCAGCATCAMCAACMTCAAVAALAVLRRRCGCGCAICDAACPMRMAFVACAVCAGWLRAACTACMTCEDWPTARPLCGICGVDGACITLVWLAAQRLRRGLPNARGFCSMHGVRRMAVHGVCGMCGMCRIAYRTGLLRATRAWLTCAVLVAWLAVHGAACVWHVRVIFSVHAVCFARVHAHCALPRTWFICCTDTCLVLHTYVCAHGRNFALHAEHMPILAHARVMSLHSWEQMCHLSTHLGACESWHCRRILGRI